MWTGHLNDLKRGLKIGLKTDLKIELKTNLTAVAAPSVAAMIELTAATRK